MFNTIEYKSYIGSIEYSSEDKCFFGKLEMINDLVTFEATNAEELETNFHNIVDEYLKTCEELEKNSKNIKEALMQELTLHYFKLVYLL